MITFLVFGFIFLGLGIVLYIMSDQVTEASIRYDNLTVENITNSDGVSQPTINTDLILSEDMKAPIFVYYELENFYQNHRRYVKSRSYEQLRGESMSVEDIETDCDPITTYADLGMEPLNPLEDFDAST